MLINKKKRFYFIPLQYIYYYCLNCRQTIILGGFTNKLRFESFENIILSLIRGNTADGGDDDDDIDPQVFQQFINSIKWFNPRFNIDTVIPEITGECSFEIIVNQYDDDQIIVLQQHIKNLNNWDIVIGVVVMAIESEEKRSWAAINPIAKLNFKGSYQIYNSFVFLIEEKISN
jgi:hypothetical protein